MEAADFNEVNNLG